MTPTLLGRLETRVLSVLLAGVAWTGLVTPLLILGGLAGGTGGLGRLAGLGGAYRVTFSTLGLLTIFGLIIWEPLYQLLQQFRWEKDWPAIFVLAQAVPEAILVHVGLRLAVGGPGIGWPAFVLDFGTTWLAIFVFVHGPIRVPFLRWRFRGGRII
ncbi:MAG: hypothetical protein ACRDX8_01090 [Acidimicrobiales bacterium]